MNSAILNSKLRTFKLNSQLSKFKQVNPSSIIKCQMSIVGFSKFQETDIKSDLEINMPMQTDIKILSEGQNRDGFIKRSDLEASLEGWSNLPIIDFHDMSDMLNPTSHKHSDRKGYTLEKSRLEFIDGKMWVVCPAEIHDRAIAYQLYLRAKRGKPLRVSAEYKWRRSFIGDDQFQTNLRPHIISLVEKGHISGNSIAILSE